MPMIESYHTKMVAPDNFDPEFPFGPEVFITEHSSHASQRLGVPGQSAPREDVECSDHPDAPHGFCRDASHSAGRCVCECEGWTPEEEEAWIDKLRDLAGVTS